jgi:uncharacterized protein YraI
MLKQIIGACCALCMCTAFASAAFAERVTVTSTNLNLRAGPGSEFPVLAVVPRGTSLDAECGHEWCRVRMERGSGYAARFYLHAEPAAEPAANPIPTPSPIPGGSVSQPRDEGARIGRWTDREQRDLLMRNIQWRNRHRPMPGQ